MLKAFLPLIFLGLVSCSVDIPDPNDQPEETETTETTDGAYEVNPTKDICSYRKDKNKGCLKATISSTELSVGDTYYPLGVEQFVRTFDEDLGDTRAVNLNEKESLAFAKKQTLHKFYSNFNITVEGAHTTYPAYHVGLGNIQVNGMAVGYYNVLVSKEFDFYVLKNDKEIGYKCAIVWARQTIEVVAGRETALPQPISEFEVEVYSESCSGKTFEPKKPKKDTNGEGSQEAAGDIEATTSDPTGTSGESVPDGEASDGESSE